MGFLEEGKRTTHYPPRTDPNSMSDAAILATIAEATKTSGPFLEVEPEDFARILEKHDAPLVIHKQGGVFSTHHKYLTSYRGFFFYTKTKDLLYLKGGTEVIEAKSMWIPNF